MWRKRRPSGGNSAPAASQQPRCRLTIVWTAIACPMSRHGPTSIWARTRRLRPAAFGHASQKRSGPAFCLPMVRGRPYFLRRTRQSPAHQRMLVGRAVTLPSASARPRWVRSTSAASSTRRWTRPARTASTNRLIEPPADLPTASARRRAAWCRSRRPGRTTGARIDNEGICLVHQEQRGGVAD